MVLIGRLSYSIYLFHLSARTPGEVYFGSPFQAGSVISGVVLTWVLAFSLFILVERPLAGLRRRFRAKGDAARSATTIDPLRQASVITISQEPT